MSRKISQGVCSYCNKIVAQNMIGRHLVSCPERKTLLAKLPEGKARTTKIYDLFVDGGKPYWLYIEVPADAMLKHLDQFLRDMWLECCGHMSAFKVQGTSYMSHPMYTHSDKTMNIRLEKIFKPDVKVYYEYDFGSTTDLTLKYVSEREGSYIGNKPTILARNVAPVIPCDVCAQPATRVCSMCVHSDHGWFCEKHATNHECYLDALLPVVNSPRVGVCGYTGN